MEKGLTDSELKFNYTIFLHFCAVHSSAKYFFVSPSFKELPFGHISHNTSRLTLKHSPAFMVNLATALWSKGMVWFP